MRFIQYLITVGTERDNIQDMNMNCLVILVFLQRVKM